MRYAIRMEKNVFAAAFVVILVVAGFLYSFSLFVGVAVAGNVTDTTPPTTSSSFTSDGWESSDITITLGCTDNIECNLTYYCIDSSNYCDPWSGTKYQNQDEIMHAIEGVYYIRFASKDSSNNVEDTKSQVLKIDKTAPIITIDSPSDGTELSGNSYVISGTSADNLSSLDKVEINTGGTWEVTVGKEVWQYSWVLTEGSHTIKAKATDNAGNSAVQEISVTVDNPPTARITCLGNPPLVGAGKVKVTLLTSENVQYTPELSYKFNDVSSSVQIPLGGVGNEWSGYMVLGSEDNDRIGKFYFSAKDLDGEEDVGELITEGSYFVVDSIKPPKPVDIRAEGNEDYVKLSWFYEGEELSKFKIYRAKIKEIDYADFYKSAEASSNTKTDKSVEEGVTYYYKIAAVDLAGNVGELSEEVSAFAEENESKIVVQAQTSPEKLSSYLTEEVDNEIISINVLKSEFETSASYMDTDLSSTLELDSKIDQGKRELNNLKAELENLKAKDLTESVFNQEINSIKLKVEVIKKSTPKSIEVLDKAEFEQKASSEELDTVINEVLLNSDNYIDSGQKKIYARENERLQDEVKIKVKVRVISIKYFDNAVRELTLIQKEILTERANISIVEFIPKNVASNIEEIDFKTHGYSIIKEDPIVKWPYVEEIIYVINKKLELGESRQAKSILLLDPKETLGRNWITGATTGISENLSSAGIVFGIIIIAVLVAYYLIFIKGGGISSFVGYKDKDRGGGKVDGGRISRNRISRDRIDGERKSSESLGSDYEHERSAHDYSSVIFPFSKSLQGEQEINKKTDNIYELLEKAGNYIDNGKFDVARKAYVSISNVFRLLGRAEQEKVYDDIIKLYNKLSLHLKIREAGGYVKNDMYKKLGGSLKEIFNLYEMLAKNSQDTELMKFVRNRYNYYQNILSCKSNFYAS